MDIKIAVSILIAVFYLLYFLYLQNNTIDLTRYEINSNEINETIKLIHLSDLHSKPFMKVIKHIEIEKPDIILITGDFINDKCKRKEKMLSFARQLTKYAKVYYITGNHERRLDEF